MEYFTTGGKMPFLGDKAQRLQFVAAQIAKQSNGFKRGHRRALYQFQHVIAHFLQRCFVSAGGINGAVADRRYSAKANCKW